MWEELELARLAYPPPKDAHTPYHELAGYRNAASDSLAA